jgi:hypothetical protein
MPTKHQVDVDDTIDERFVEVGASNPTTVPMTQRSGADDKGCERDDR